MSRTSSGARSSQPGSRPSARSMSNASARILDLPKVALAFPDPQGELRYRTIIIADQLQQVGLSIDLLGRLWSAGFLVGHGLRSVDYAQL